LEDELGDVLEKAMRRSGMGEEALAERAGVSSVKIREAIDYRPDLSLGELRQLAAALGLNEVGLCALAHGRYPLPAISPLPFCVWPLRTPHGVGVANAYLVGECGASKAILFDTGAGIAALESVWPRSIQQVEAVFVTHVEAEHAGGLDDVIKRFGVRDVFIPCGAVGSAGRPMGEGETHVFGPLEVRAFTTPGHAAAHNCYAVCAHSARRGDELLISGDLLFAGSVGGAYFCQTQLQTHLRRILSAMPSGTVIAPGHGPLTTVENEVRFNPFAG